MSVVYVSNDTGDEVDPVALYKQVAIDSSRRAQRGSCIISMSLFPVRHSAAYVARQGSGYQSKVAVAVVNDMP